LEAHTGVVNTIGGPVTGSSSRFAPSAAAVAAAGGGSGGSGDVQVGGRVGAGVGALGIMTDSARVEVRRAPCFRSTHSPRGVGLRRCLTTVGARAGVHVANSAAHGHGRVAHHGDAAQQAQPFGAPGPGVTARGIGRPVWLRGRAGGAGCAAGHVARPGTSVHRPHAAGAAQGCLSDGWSVLSAHQGHPPWRLRGGRRAYAQSDARCAPALPTPRFPTTACSTS